MTFGCSSNPIRHFEKDCNVLCVIFKEIWIVRENIKYMNE